MICRFFKQGRCRFGTACWNQHHEAGEPSTRSTTEHTTTQLVSLSKKRCQPESSQPNLTYLDHTTVSAFNHGLSPRAARAKALRLSLDQNARRWNDQAHDPAPTLTPIGIHSHTDTDWFFTKHPNSSSLLLYPQAPTSEGTQPPVCVINSDLTISFGPIKGDYMCKAHGRLFRTVIIDNPWSQTGDTTALLYANIWGAKGKRSTPQSKGSPFALLHCLPRS